MKRFIMLFTGLVLLFLAYTPILASAHVLETDKSIGAVLHIDPADDPVAGQQSNFYLEFQDKSGRLDLKKCACSFSMSEAGKVLTTQPMGVSNSATGTAQFFFPARDIYVLSVFGTPQAGGTFQAFKLDFEIRVDRGTQSANSKATVAPLKESFLAGIAVMAIYLAVLCYILLGKVNIKK